MEIYPIVNAFRYTIVRSLYWKIKAILAEFVRIRSNFRIRMKIPSRRRMHPSIVQVDPTPPGHPAEAREFVRVPATSCGRCRAQQPRAATIGSGRESYFQFWSSTHLSRTILGAEIARETLDQQRGFQHASIGHWIHRATKNRPTWIANTSSLPDSQYISNVLAYFL